jgi:hypothetical protein
LQLQNLIIATVLEVNIAIIVTVVDHSRSSPVSSILNSGVEVIPAMMHAASSSDPASHVTVFLRDKCRERVND